MVNPCPGFANFEDSRTTLRRIEMTPIEIGVLTSAGAAGVIHTLIGPDHTIPFIALAKIHHWTWKKAVAITAACGVAHVGIAWFIGMGLIRLSASPAAWAKTLAFQSQGAAWGLILFGALYLVWGLRAAFRRKETQTPGTTGAWVLFLLFVFGPCESLLPFLATAQAAGRPALIPLMTLVFGAATIGTMVAGVLLGVGALSKVKGLSGRWSPALSGGAILLSGLAVKFAGL
jgi:nickel/cobalt exporter